MRELKFKGKHIATGEWLFGSHYDDGGEEYILPNIPASAIDYEDYQVDPNTVGQFIGLYDKNGNGVYEGDIVHLRGKGGCGFYDKLRRYEVSYEDGFIFLQLPKKAQSKSLGDIKCLVERYCDMEIVGNIHDNR